MKKILLLCTFALVANFLTAQELDPVAWEWKAEKISDSEFNLIFTAKMDDGWFVYSQFLGEDGPIPTAFEYDDKSIELVGRNVEEGAKKKEGYDEMFDMNLIKFGGTATFTQKVKVSKGVDKISGALTYMTCDDMRCLPPKDVEFVVNLVD